MYFVYFYCFYEYFLCVCVLLVFTLCYDCFPWVSFWFLRVSTDFLFIISVLVYFCFPVCYYSFVYVIAASPSVIAGFFCV